MSLQLEVLWVRKLYMEAGLLGAFITYSRVQQNLKDPSRHIVMATILCSILWTRHYIYRHFFHLDHVIILSNYSYFIYELAEAQ